MRKLAGFIAAAGLVFTVACAQTDAGITTSVKSKLAADDTVKAYQVDVTTANNVVTLSGDVSTSAARERAIALARETDGVRDVIDQLRVTESAATSGLLDRDGAPARGLDVDVDADRDGVRDEAAAAAGRVGDKTERAGDSVADSAKRTGRATKDLATDVGKATASGAKKVGAATADGAKKVGGAVKDAVKGDDGKRDGK